MSHRLLPHLCLPARAPKILVFEPRSRDSGDRPGSGRSGPSSSQNALTSLTRDSPPPFGHHRALAIGQLQVARRALFLTCEVPLCAACMHRCARCLQGATRSRLESDTSLARPSRRGVQGSFAHEKTPHPLYNHYRALGFAFSVGSYGGQGGCERGTYGRVLRGSGFLSNSPVRNTPPVGPHSSPKT